MPPTGLESGVADDERTRRWERLAPPPPIDKGADKDPVHAMRTAIAAVRKAPHDDEARRRLRALATEQDTRDQLALLLSDEARASIDSLAAMGVDVIKLHSQLNRETYLAAAQYARERGLRVAGHVPGSVSAAEASDAGVGSIEHMLQIPISCTPAESLALVPRFPMQWLVGRVSSQDMAPFFAPVGTLRSAGGRRRSRSSTS